MPARDDDLKLTKAIAKRLAALRKKKGITQQDLAGRLGVSQAAVSQYEKGESRLTASMLVKIAKALDVSADNLLGLKSK